MSADRHITVVGLPRPDSRFIETLTKRALGIIDREQTGQVEAAKVIVRALHVLTMMAEDIEPELDVETVVAVLAAEVAAGMEVEP